MKDSAMSINLNLEEALFVELAIKTAIKGMSKEDLEIFWPDADIANILNQLYILIDVLYAEEMINDEKEKQKLFASLVRMGYSFSEIKEASAGITAD